MLVALAKSNIERTLVSDTLLPSDNPHAPRNANVQIRVNVVTDSEDPGKPGNLRGRIRDTVLALGPGRVAFDSGSEHFGREERGEVLPE